MSRQEIPEIRCVGETQKLYEADSALTCFEATVLACRPMENGHYAVILDRTAFFPEGGGQYADTGVLGESRVLDVQIDENCLIHETDMPLTVGATVRGELNAEQRYTRMQHHTGEHILSGLIHAQYGYDNVGFHLSDTGMTMDVNGPLNALQLQQIELAANRVVWENHSVTAYYPDADILPTLTYRAKLNLTENVRLVTIEGVDVCACCAPHVASTGEVGVIRIAEHMNYKGGVRLSVVCGAAAVRLWQTERDTLDLIARSFSVARGETPAAVLQLQKVNSELRGVLGQCRRDLLCWRMEEAAATGERHLLLFDCGDDTNAMRYAAQRGAACCEGIAALFSTAEDHTVRYVAISDHISLRPIARDFHAAVGGRGGGSDQMIQGSVPDGEDAIRAFFAAR